jgi:hypothetical protein
MNRDYAEKQDLWAEMNDLWVNRQLRRRKTRLSILALMSVVLMGGVYVYQNLMVVQDPVYLHVKGQSLSMEPSTAQQRTVSSVDQRDNAIEITETISI